MGLPDNLKKYNFRNKERIESPDPEVSDKVATGFTYYILLIL
jgi:hypothetical protein